MESLSPQSNIIRLRRTTAEIKGEGPTSDEAPSLKQSFFKPRTEKSDALPWSKTSDSKLIAEQAKKNKPKEKLDTIHLENFKAPQEAPNVKVVPETWLNLSSDQNLEAITLHKNGIVTVHRVEEDLVVIQIWSVNTTIPNLKSNRELRNARDFFMDNEEGTLAVSKKDGSLDVLRLELDENGNPSFVEATYPKIIQIVEPPKTSRETVDKPVINFESATLKRLEVA